MRIEISLIIPVYNAEKYLKQCLDSVVNQTIQERIEVILVNDGSTDDSGKIMLEYEAKYPNLIRNVFQKNGGASSARNAALDIAQGEYLVFMDSDDFIGPHYLEELYYKAVETKADMVLCDYTRVTADGEFYKRCVANHIERGIRIPSYISCNRIVHRNLFEEYHIRYREGVVGEDIPAMLQLEAVAKHVEVISMAEYYYRMNPKSVTSTFSKINIEKFPFDAIKDCVKFCMEEEHMLEYDKLEFYICRIWTSLLLDDGRKCAKEMRRTLCEKISDFMQEYFPECHKNQYVKLNYFSKIPKAHRWGTWIFVKALRFRMLNVLSFICSIV